MKTLVALALVPLAAAAAPTPVLSGLYAVGDLGLVQFTVSDGKVVGKLRLSSECDFPRDTQVVTGAFEGDVFIGSVTLCQTGAGCAAQRTYPMLGVSLGDAVGGFIKLERACQSKALDRGQLYFRPATPEQKQKVAGEASASAIATARNKDPAVAAAVAIKEGDELLSKGLFSQARDQFSLAIELHDENWQADLGYAVAEVKLGQPQRAFPYFERALKLAAAGKASAGDIAFIHYNRGCALLAVGNKKGSLDALRLAVKVGGASNFVEQLTIDTDLEPLRKDPDFKRFVAEVQLAHNRKKPR